MGLLGPWCDPHQERRSRLRGEAEHAAPGRPADGRRVLLVDDEAAVRRTAQRMLEHAGFVVEAVEMNGDAYLLAVQWELQEEWRVDRRFLEPFAQLVSAAAER